MPTSTPKNEASGDEVVQALKDAAHAVLGFGVMGWNKVQAYRRDWVKDMNGRRGTVEDRLDGAREQLATAIRNLDHRLEPVRNDIDVQLDKAEERLPDQVRDLVKSARKFARDTEHQVRQAVGAL
jgi:hypothetical protein